MRSVGADVWSDLVGQEQAVGALKRAVAGAGLPGGKSGGMTSAWLFTGPPGSGRSTAARAFAAALHCERGGCGSCERCRTTLAGSSPDARFVRTDRLSLGVDGIRGLILDAARAPVESRWLVVLIEDADRLTEPAAAALLKSIEEPAPRTVWLLCAPALEDVPVTIRSRCRHVSLRIPPADAVADLLVRKDGIDPAMAAFAARAAQGHVGRARRLATDEHSRRRRHDSLRLPTLGSGLGERLAAAAQLAEDAGDDAAAATSALDEREHADLARALGVGTTGRAMPVGAARQLKQLERDQKGRATRARRDGIDRVLVDLTSFYRDVLVLQLARSATSPGQAADRTPELVNEEARPDVERVAAGSTPEQTLRRIEAVMQCRDRIEANSAPLLALEALTLALR